MPINFYKGGWMKMRYVLYGVMCLGSLPLFANRTLYNETKIPLYVAGYHVLASGEAKLVTARTKLMPDKNVSFDVTRTGIASTTKRYIVVSRNENDFTQTMTLQDVKSFPHKSLKYPALPNLLKFYFEEQNGRLVMLNSLEHSDFVKAISGAKETVKEGIIDALIDKETLPEVKNNKHRKDVAVVRTTNVVPAEETAIIKKRKAKVNKAVNKAFNLTLLERKTPTISLVCSGGGYRAMLATLGFMVGMETAGVLDMTTYISGLSGSTWFLGTWINSKKTVNAFKTDLINLAKKKIGVLTPKEMKLISNAYKVKVAYREPLTIVDLFGALLANMLFDNLGDKRQQVLLSDQAKTLAAGDWPFPIYVAVDGRKAAHKQYGWYEFTPFEVGSPWLGHYVPLWGFGRTFSNGKSITDDPEIPLGFLFGIFGSAFSASIERIWQEIMTGKEAGSSLDKFVKETIIHHFGDSRLAMSEEHNFTLGMDTSPIRDDKYMTMIDAGIDFNLPYPAVSGEKERRQSDILIFFDASYSTAIEAGKRNVAGSLKDLMEAEKYARDRGLKFPHIDANILVTPMTIFKDNNDPACPLVIWFPLTDDQQLITTTLSENNQLTGFDNIKDFNVAKCAESSFCDTFNFGYAQAESEKLVNLCTFNVLANKDALLAAIKWKIDKMK